MPTETVKISRDLEIDLQIPSCDLMFDVCTSAAECGIQVHGCRFHYACSRCAYEFVRRVNDSYRMFGLMRCKACKRKFKSSGFYLVQKLTEGNK